MKIDQAIYDEYQAELKPLKDASRHAKYDRQETHVWDTDDGSTIDIGVGGEAAELDERIKKVESKYTPSLKKEAEDEFNNILEITRSRCPGK